MESLSEGSNKQFSYGCMQNPISDFAEKIRKSYFSLPKEEREDLEFDYSLKSINISEVYKIKLTIRQDAITRNGGKIRSLKDELKLFFNNGQQESIYFDSEEDAKDKYAYFNKLCGFIEL